MTEREFAEHCPEKATSVAGPSFVLFSCLLQALAYLTCVSGCVAVREPHSPAARCTEECLGWTEKEGY